MQILRTHARTRWLRAKQSHFISLPLLTINRWWWPNFNGKPKTVSRISLYAFLSWDAKPLFEWVVSTDILDVRLLLFEAVLTSSNIMFFSNPHLFLSLFCIPFQMNWRKFLPGQWFSRIFCICMRNCNFCVVHANQSNQILYGVYI